MMTPNTRRLVWFKVVLPGTVFATFFILKSSVGPLPLSAFDVIPIEVGARCFRRIPSESVFLALACLLHFVLGALLGALAALLPKVRNVNTVVYAGVSVILAAALNISVSLLWPVVLMCYDVL